METRIIFNDDTSMTVKQNGSCFITATRPGFPDDLSIVTVEGDDGAQVFHNVMVQECASVDGRYWFTLIEKTAEEIENEAIHAQLVANTETTNIAFVVLAESGVIDEVTAGEHMSVFSPWEPNVDYVPGNLRVYPPEGTQKLYKCVQAHRSQDDWTPDKAVSLWSTASDPAVEFPEWSKPVGAHDAYKAGAKVSHNDKHWISDADGNVWEPGVYGWTEMK